MLRVVGCVCALLALAYGQTTNVQKCIFFSGPLPLHTYVEGCVTPPCLLQRGHDAVITFEFQAPHAVQSMTTIATALMVFPIPYLLREAAHTCNYLTNSTCPLEEGEIVHYTLNMFIDPIFRLGTSLPFELRIKDDSHNTLVCVRVPVTIVAPLLPASTDVVPPLSTDLPPPQNRSEVTQTLTSDQ